VFVQLGTHTAVISKANKKDCCHVGHLGSEEDTLTLTIFLFLLIHYLVECFKKCLYAEAEAHRASLSFIQCYIEPL